MDTKRKPPTAAQVANLNRLAKLAGVLASEAQKNFTVLVKHARRDAKTRFGVSLGKRVEYSSGARIARAIAGTAEAKAFSWTDADTVAAIADKMILEGYIIRAVVVGKKLKGRTVLEPFPPAQQQFESGHDSQYIWTFETSSLKNTLLGGLVIAATIVGCMLPLWPNWMRVGVWYLAVAAVGLLGVIAVFLLLRAMAFAAVWVVSRGTLFFWVFPNFLADVDFLDSFRPWYSLETGAKSDGGTGVAAGEGEDEKDASVNDKSD